jgi:hypothetical protein
MLIWALRASVTAGLLYWLTRQVDIRQVWAQARDASVGWLVVALALYLAVIVVGSWRWNLLLRAQHIAVALPTLVRSYLIATYFNNFLPSNFGGDVVRIADTARAAGSKTLATTVVFLDRVVGLLGLLFVAAVGATSVADRSDAVGPIGPGLLWAALGGAIVAVASCVLMPERVGQVLSPLRALHQEWVEERLSRLTLALEKFRAAPQALAIGFCGAIAVQILMLAFYAAIARALHIGVPMRHLAILVPVSFVVQMIPVSINGFGLRENTFRIYFARVGLVPEAGVTLSLVGAATMMLFSVSGAVAYLTRRRQ